ncbi:pep-cterm sorting domain-containing protein [Anaeramoeba ignava]|uniref:Pep-cterm sorting domain-containing protein n=1 Tax=Anaeramoeba ignava TaxID=1746090 RepID=A0A9Q0LDP1_ANAIG|nr:pep-cterm sorting domain-containing protein [Anaeramoeba ignava]
MENNQNNQNNENENENEIQIENENENQNEIQIENENQNQNQNENENEFQKELIQNYQKLLNLDQNYSDIVIKVSQNSKQFKCHKSILTCQSPFFSIYLKENEANEIIFEDISEQDMNQIIQFIYTRNIQLNQSNLFSIWFLSIKFQLKSLQNYIENQFIIKNFNLQLFFQNF